MSTSPAAGPTGPPPYTLPAGAAGPVAVQAHAGGSDAGDSSGAGGRRAVRTWRDLPSQPPFGPVPPMRAPQPRRPRRFSAGAAAPPVEGSTPQITPAQIGLAVLGVVVLLAVGVGAALFLLDEDVEVADTPLPAETEPDTPFGQLTPAPAPPPAGSGPDPAPPAAPAPTEQSPQGQLEPVPAPDAGADPDEPPPGEPPPGEAAPGEDPSGENPSGEAPPGAQPGPPAPPPGAPQPEVAPPPAGGPTDGEVDLPRLFTLSQLPRDTVEEDTAVTHTSGGDEDEALVQTTRLVHPDGEITVRATRSDAAAGRFESLREGGQEVTVRGQPAYVREGQHLIWLVEGDPATLVEVDGPATIGTDELLTIANGLELTR